jgi:hypothetical protein
MCYFFSFLGFRNGDFFHASDVTNSHEHLIRACKVRDSEAALLTGNFFRGEFTPPTEIKTVSDLSTWRLKVDEPTAPDWYDEAKTREWCERQVSQMIIRDARTTILGGCWILDGEKASLNELVRGRIAIAANGADLARADLARAYLARADLARADLARAYLAGANLARADLARAYLAGANLARADLAGADLSGAYGIALPDGWEINAIGIAARKAAE